MKMEKQRHQIEEELESIPSGTLSIVHNSASGHDHILLTDSFSAATSGKGKIEIYHVFPGVEASYNTFSAQEAAFHHAASSSVLEIFYCCSGRIGWNMDGGTAVYLGPGDVTIHSTACCADSSIMFPLGYAEGISVTADLRRLEKDCPVVLQEARADFQELQDRYCSGKPAAIPACPESDWIFHPLYTVPSARRRSYLQLKVQELLLYLLDFRPGKKALTQYVSEQTERIRQIHRELTEHPEQRFTVEELSKRYLINTSTLKEVFKAVYGLPVATYMKEYRMRQAAELLRETNDTVAEIAQKAGYRSQGKFSGAFKDVMQILPTEYRKIYGNPEKTRSNTDDMPLIEMKK